MSGSRRPGALVADRLEVRYADRLALGPVDLAMSAGALVAVTGSSASGKSTLLAALSGALTPTSGAVSLAGDPVGDRRSASLLGIAFMPQGGALVSTLTATENVVVSLLGLRVPPLEAEDRARAALLAVGLADEGGHLPEELSGGQRQRVAVAVLLASSGRVLLLDEPTSELDGANRQRVLAALRTEAAKGAVVAFATHDPEAAAEADAELQLDEGRATWVRPLAGVPAVERG